MSTWHEPRLRLAQLRAREILRELRIQKPSEIVLEAIAWRRRVMVVEEDLTGSDGRSIRERSRKVDAIVSVKRGIPEVGKKRFIIAHELGHCELHPNTDQFVLCRDRDFYSYRKVLPDEAEANAFAAELLMPEDFYKPRCQDTPSIGLISELASDFNVTLISAAFRYVDFSSERVGFVVTDNGQIRWAKFSEGFRYDLTPGQKLDPGTYAADYFTHGALPNGFQSISAHLWGINKRDRCVFEESLPMHRYNSVATLIWDRYADPFEDEEDEEEVRYPPMRFKR